MSMDLNSVVHSVFHLPTNPAEFRQLLASSWEVFLLFTIPIGGGIPGGVLLGRHRGLGLLMLFILYFLSDVALALIFEPLMLLMIHLGKRFQGVARFMAAMKKSNQKLVSKYGVRPNPFLLVMIAFGSDPMTGRAVARAAGHGFWSGWAIAILGDLLSFTVVMVSIIWLSDLLGNGTWATIMILVVMIVAPPLFRRIRHGFAKKSTVLKE